ncbi:MAG: ribbon-helix-helix protein, CopG family [Candidatus Altiarchaeota archaeon]|nr:ribbon-helix-helix protein, CopG family [Candidatus Altiarchaeota archaeon]
MESLQIRLTPQIIKKVDELVEAGMYASRNEAVRDAVRRLVLHYDAVSRTGALREEITPKPKGKRGVKLIRD